MAMTDVTGFGLMGHLSEICEGSNVGAVIDYEAVPKLDHVEAYRDLGCSPGGAQRNFDSYGHKLGAMSTGKMQILCDPQTSGGLLVAVTPQSEEEFLTITRKHDFNLSPIGELVEYKGGPLIEIR
jgi:selenide,water dikinase